MISGDVPDGMPDRWQSIFGAILARKSLKQSFQPLIRGLTDEEARYMKTFIEGMYKPLALLLESWGLPPLEGAGFWRGEVLPLLEKRLASPPSSQHNGGNVFQTVEAAFDIVDIAAKYIDLKKSGKTYKGRCPLHADRSPSFVVYPESQTWNCFGACGVRGQDVIELTRRLMEAKKW